VNTAPVTVLHRGVNYDCKDLQYRPERGREIDINLLFFLSFVRQFKKVLKLSPLSLAQLIAYFDLIFNLSHLKKMN